jgi:hypothetical protein
MRRGKRGKYEENMRERDTEERDRIGEREREREREREGKATSIMYSVHSLAPPRYVYGTYGTYIEVIFLP